MELFFGCATSSNCRSRLKLGSLLQEGTYGRVYEGLLLRSKNSRVRKSSDEEGESDSSLGMDEEDLEVPEEEDIMVKSVLTGTSQSQCHLLVQVSQNQRFQSTYIIYHFKDLLLNWYFWQLTIPWQA